MATLNAPSKLGWIDLYTSDTTIPSGYSLGMLQYGSDGKAFRYAKAGASALVVGNVLQSPAIDTQFDDMAVPAAVASGSAGAIVITNGTTAVAANDFVGGTLSVSVTPGLGEEYTILGHSTATSGSALSVYLDRPIRTAWTTSTKVTLRKSPWGGVIQAPTTLTGVTVGVAVYAIPSGEYGWVQTKGIAGVLSDNSTGAVGSALSNSAATAGAAGVFVAGTGRSMIGHANRALATGKVVPVYLNID